MAFSVTKYVRICWLSRIVHNRVVSSVPELGHVEEVIAVEAGHQSVAQTKRKSIILAQFAWIHITSVWGLKLFRTCPPPLSLVWQISGDEIVLSAHVKCGVRERVAAMRKHTLTQLRRMAYYDDDDFPLKHELFHSLLWLIEAAAPVDAYGLDVKSRELIRSFQYMFDIGFLICSGIWRAPSSSFIINSDHLRWNTDLFICISVFVRTQSQGRYWFDDRERAPRWRRSVW